MSSPDNAAAAALLNPSTPSKGPSQVVDVRDVIADRVTRLAGPVRALERLATLRGDLPARDEALAFCAAFETMTARYTDFVEADAKAAEAEIIGAINASTCNGLIPS